MKRKILLPCFAMLSVLLAAYGPMTTFASAEAANDAKLHDLKTKAISELTRRIDSYKKTLQSLNIEVKVDKDSASAKAATDQGSVSGDVEHHCTPAASGSPSASPSSSPSPSGAGASFSLQNGALKGDVSLPCGLKDQVKGFLQQVVKELTGLLGSVQNTQSLSQMQSLGQNIDNQFGLNMLTQVQGAVTQAIDSFTGVLQNLKSTFNNVQSQVGQLKQCAQSVFGGQVTASGGFNTSPSPTASISASAPNCQGLNLSSADVANQAQNQMNSLTSVITTLSSVLMSAVTLLTTLVSSFSSMTGGLGSLGSLGNLGSLGSMLNPSQLTSLGNLGGGAGGIGSITGLLSSFSAITSQLGIGQSMSGNALGSLGSLGNLVNVGGLGNIVGL